MSESESSTMEMDELLLRYLAREGDAAEQAELRLRIESSPELTLRLEYLRADMEMWSTRLRQAGPVPPSRGGDLAGGPLPADAIPGYSILAEIGRGGQGVVYRALQQETERLVALKILRDGPLASAEALRRFDREVELAATLNHEGIVTVFEAGETPHGRRYVAMELVEGRRLDRHIEVTSPPLEQRIDLVRRIAAAIFEAHRRGVIHLDLKPTNVVVTNDGRVKVLDFGLARSMQDDDPTSTMTQVLAQGTPAYMAPEQARAGWESWDSRTDVYGLGVLLFEVITGELPYRLSGGVLEVMTAIATAAPQRPSTVVAAQERQNSGATTARGRRQLRDLDAIVGRALEKDPDQRYQTVADLERDLAAVLDGSPVSSRRDERGYRLRQALRAYALPLSIMVGVVVALVILVAFLVGVSRRETQLRQLADDRFQQVREIANVFIHDVSRSVRNLPGSAPARELIVRQGLEYLDALSRQAEDDAVLQLELARAYLAIGEIQYEQQGVSLGDRAEASESYQKAAEALARIPANAVLDELILGRTRFRVEMRMLEVHSLAGDDNAAAASMERAFQEITRLAERFPDHQGVSRDLSLVYDRKSWQAYQEGDLARANHLLDQSWELLRELLISLPDDTDLRRDDAVAHTKRASYLLAAGDQEAALEQYRQYLARAEALRDDFPGRWLMRRDVAVGQEWVGRLLSNLGKPREALTHLRSAVRSYSELHAMDPSQWLMRLAMVQVKVLLIEALIATDDPDAAAVLLDEMFPTLEQLRADHADSTRVHREYGVTLYKQFELHKARGEPRLGLKSLEACLAQFEWMKEQGLLGASDAGVPDELRGEIEALRSEIEGS